MLFMNDCELSRMDGVLERMKRFSFSVLWLKTVSVLFAVFGIIIALLNQTTIFQVIFNNQINPVFWANFELPTEALLFQRWIYGLLGATCLMVGILIFFIAKNSFARKEKWAWNCLLVGVAAWFIIDTPISMYFQVYFNVVFNIVLLLAILLPLILTRKDFYNP